MKNKKKLKYNIEIKPLVYINVIDETEIILVRKSPFYIKKRTASVYLPRYQYKLDTLHRISTFLIVNGFNSKLFLKIIFTYFYSHWEIYIELKDFSFYICLLQLCIDKYYALYHNHLFDEKEDSWMIYSRCIRTFPSSYLNFFKIEKSSPFTIGKKQVLEISRFFTKNYLYEDEKLAQSKYHNIVSFQNQNFGYSEMKINFLRVQRRYNKRRYSRVRAVSRSSFFSGISLSSIFLGLLWGGSIKSVDWLT